MLCHRFAGSPGVDILEDRILCAADSNVAADNLHRSFYFFVCVSLLVDLRLLTWLSCFLFKADSWQDRKASLSVEVRLLIWLGCFLLKVICWLMCGAAAKRQRERDRVCRQSLLPSQVQSVSCLVARLVKAVCAHKLTGAWPSGASRPTASRRPSTWRPLAAAARISACWQQRMRPSAQLALLSSRFVCRCRLLSQCEMPSFVCLSATVCEPFLPGVCCAKPTGYH